MRHHPRSGASGDAQTLAEGIAVGHEAPSRADVEVHDLIGQLDTEGTIAALEARVQDLEQELERAETRAFEAERARQGDLEMMRARTQDALELVRVSMEEQRLAFRSFEGRYTGLVAAAEEAGRANVDELREAMSPAIQRALVRSDEVAAELRGELGALAAETERLLRAVTDLGDGQDRLGADLQALSDRTVEERQDREAAVEAVDERVGERLSAVEEATRYRLLEERGRVEALRRELDAAIGELRAGLNLKAGELIERIEDNRIELAERLEHHDRAVVDLEERLRAAVVRREGELDPVHRSADELRSRVAALEAKVAETMNGLAGSLTNRVSEVAGRLDALHEAAVRHEQRLSGVEQLERRVAEIAMRRSEPAPSPAEASRVDGLATEVEVLRQRERMVDRRLEGIERFLREVSMRLPGEGDGVEASDGLRHEIRDLAARTSELAARLEETERIARTTGHAVTRLIRHSRRPDAPAEAAAPPADAAEERPLFGDRHPEP